MNDRIAKDLIRYAELVEDGALISPEEMNCASLMRIAAEALAQPKYEPVEDLQAKLKWATEQLEANINWEFVAAAKEEMLKAAWAEIKELREQIKEPEQRSVSEHLEPVAHDNCRAERICRSWCGNSACASHYADTTPPPVGFAVMQKPWVGLTDEEIERDYYGRHDFVRAVELRIKEKNT